MTNGGRQVKMGRTYDYECSRTTARLQSADTILRTVGIVASYPEHAESCILHESKRSMRYGHYVYSCECGRGHDPAPTWPEWATDEMFEHAWALADKAQTERGAAARRKM